MDKLGFHQEGLTTSEGQNSTEAVTIGEALRLLENSLVAFEGDLQFDLSAFSNELINLSLERVQDQRGQVITIIDVSEFTFPSEVASRLALIISCFTSYAFTRISRSAPSTPILSIHLTSPLITEEKTTGWNLKMSVEALAEGGTYTLEHRASGLERALTLLCGELGTKAQVQEDTVSCFVTIELDEKLDLSAVSYP